MDPSSIPGETTGKTISSSSVSRGVQREKCPPGTVPIRRTTKEDLIIDKYVIENAKPMHTNDYPVTQMKYRFVSIEENIPGKAYFGATASITGHNLTVGLDQFSTSQIWIQNGGPEGANSIQFGIAKYPLIFGDSHSRLFGYWTADGDLMTGCFNIRCPGFVQVSRNTTFGDGFDQSSVYGEIVYDESFMVYRNPVSGHWWLSMGATADTSEPIGYWPKELFTHLANSASVVRFGGVAGAVSGRPTPPLGNGYLPRLDDYLKTAFMSKMKYFSMQTKKDARPDCYDIWLAGNLGGGWGITMVYGGPGGMCF
ncbi:hypothetical protein MKX01_014594 [Papaver californicum]|nr:hypothetical protein MKX01_014594 [Papaver californicum]